MTTGAIKYCFSFDEERFTGLFADAVNPPWKVEQIA
jgi:hypothetical protein